MAGQTTAVAFLGATIAATAAGPMTEVFNELGLVLAVMGGLGGLTRGLAIRITWREICRGVILGGLFGFGLGVLSPQIVHRLFDVAIEPGTPAIPAMSAAAFLVGFMQDIIVTWVNTKGKRS